MRPEPFALERFFARTEFTARHLLATSDCEGLALEELLALANPDLLAQWHGLRLGYTESEGASELRAEVAGLYESVSGDAILVSAPEEAVFLFMNALLDPGDHVVCTFPGYQSLYQLAVSLGCEVSFWEPRENARWRFDPRRLESLIRPHTKLVVWNFPHNPTGALPSQEEFRAMLDAAAKVGAWVFSDEMYRLLEPSPEKRLPAAVDRYERAVSLAGMSKVFGLAGLRIGWLAAHDQGLLRAVQGDQGLHDHLQQRSQRDAGAHRPARPRRPTAEASPAATAEHRDGLGLLRPAGRRLLMGATRGGNGVLSAAERRWRRPRPQRNA